MSVRPRISGPQAGEDVKAGYEGETQDAFVAKLRAAGVARVIDTRHTPLSRKRGFSKTLLAERHAAEGIDYVHLKAMGTPKAWRDEYKRTKDFAFMEGKYERHLDEQMATVAQIAALAREKRTVLICFEAEAHRCHRSTIARRLVEAFGGFTITDL